MTPIQLDNINFYNRINKSNGAPKGRKITQKTRNKISKSLSGKPKSEEHIQKIKNRIFSPIFKINIEKNIFTNFYKKFIIVKQLTKRIGNDYTETIYGNC